MKAIDALYAAVAKNALPDPIKGLRVAIARKHQSNPWAGDCSQRVRSMFETGTGELVAEIMGNNNLAWFVKLDGMESQGAYWLDELERIGSIG